MGTPFIGFLEPTKLEGYRVGASDDDQLPSIPKTFLDAMEVRKEVFVKEQDVPAENEFDTDDSRSCHWVVYASINKTVVAEVRDDSGNVLQPRRSSTRTTPAGTIRLVPFPHEPHPKPNGRYWAGVLEESGGGTAGGAGRQGGLEASGGPGPTKSYAPDRPTTFHNGKEPYVKLGRLAVHRDFRGNHLAGLLVRTTLDWLRGHPSYFDPSVKELGLEQMGAATDAEVPKWEGLVCVHAQVQVADLWRRWGFEVDEGMGVWWEEGIEHVGMFQRLAIDNKKIHI
ncbi:hypothetical protein ESCO_002230 [Escovopsis weberi]|uniref:Uncharacterized protein n=1 Tax=Escovopsis weberi TaxID=150374 RepID=A0A0M8N804_ESCWE|nr:hypothetical protein ESCO_002230 [Escovopsis weberi]